MLSRFSPVRSLVALSVIAAGCAASGDIDNPAGGPGSGGNGSDTSGSGGGNGGTSGAETTTSSSSNASSGVSTPTSSSSGGEGGAPSGPGGGNPDGGAGPGGGEGGDGPATGGGGQGGDGGSPPLPECGDGERNGTEACEGADLDGETCESIGQGFIGGDLACDGECDFDTSGCTSPPDCGNGVIEGSEECDGAQLGGATCQTEGFSSGTISCTAGCALDTSDCFTCGNNVIEADEECDGSALGGATCTNLGHDGGTLTCNGTCTALVQTACSDCGDGLIESPEACDGSNFGGATCASLGFTAGTLSCTGSCSNISTANCYECGDGVISGSEVCDGAQFGGVTCQSLGFELGGTLTCNAGCLTRNTSQCVDSQCNDGIDNDGDGFVDFGSDVGCTAAADSSESVYANNCAGSGGIIYDITQNELTGYGYLLNSSTATNSTSGSCGGSGRDQTYVYRSPINQWVVFTTDQEDTAFDTVLYVRNAACNGSQIACNDDCSDEYSNYWAARNSWVEVFLTAGQTVFVTVDGFASGGGGQYVLAVFPDESWFE
jgi:hypothetical protein